MKQKIFLLPLLITAFWAGSCKKGFLDQVPTDRPSLTDVFTHKDGVQSYLANLYSAIPDEANQRFVSNSAPNNWGAGPWTAGTDEGKYTWGFCTQNTINLGTWTPSDTRGVRDLWQSYYKEIRSISYFLANVDQCKELGDALTKQYKSEAKALRALYYFYLIRAYGPVPLMGDNVIPADSKSGDSLVTKPRSSMDECVNYIVAQFEEAMPNLLSPASRNTNNADYGRIDQAIALAFEEQALLLGASPLFNGNTDYAPLKNQDGKQLISQTKNTNKWKLAADKAKLFITKFVPGIFSLYQENDPTTGQFSAYLSCRNVMYKDWNSEWIFARPNSNISTMQYDRTPRHDGAPSDQRAACGLGCTAVMADAYFMANGISPVSGYNADGSPIPNPASGWQVSGFSQFQAPFDYKTRSTFNQWVNREPRFYVGVTYDSSIWINQTGFTQANPLMTTLKKDGNSGLKSYDSPPTGLGVRKNVVAGAKWNDNGRAILLLRLANVYLDYVEALNEYDPGNADILTYLNAIRVRAGIPQYGTGVNALPVPAGQAAMRDAIWKERRVELAFENVRFFDTRRWKIAEQTDNGAFYGMNVGASSTDADKGLSFYNRYKFETRVFIAPRHYLFPIPQTEINVNAAMVQNTGW